MVLDVIRELKTEAKRLHRAGAAGDPDAVARLRRLPELKRVDEAQWGETLQRRHALAAVAREVGLKGWSHLTAVLEGSSEDFGDLLYGPGCAAHWNVWCASYEEAAPIRAEHGGYLLAYRSQFFIVERFFLETLGLDPDDEDWERIGRDWARPADPEARRRLCARAVAARLAATAR